MPHRKHKKKMRERFLTDEEFRHLGEVLNEIETHGSQTARHLVGTTPRRGQRPNDVTQGYAADWTIA